MTAKHDLEFLTPEARDAGFRIRTVGDKNAYPEKSRRRRQPSRFFLVTIGIVLVFLAVGLYGSPSKSNNVGGGFFEKLKALVLSEDRALAAQDDRYVTVLLLGQGGPGHDGPFLTDTIILARFDTETSRAAVFSLPRDLLVNIPGHGWRRINSANALGEMAETGSGAELARSTIEETLRIPIDYYARIDFSGFEKIIDALGGITVDIERSFTDLEYPDGSNQFKTVSFQAGSQHLDGEQTLIFTRSRHGDNNEGSDFARASRQQKVLLALRDRLASPSVMLNPARMKRLRDALDNTVESDMSSWELLRLMDIARGIDLNEVKSIVFDDSPGGILRPHILDDGAYVLLPRGGYESLRAAITEALNEDTGSAVAAADSTAAAPPPPNLVQAITSPNVWIMNGTTIPQLASRGADLLSAKGFSVKRIANAPEQTYATTTIIPLTATGQAHIPALTSLLDPAIAAEVPNMFAETIPKDIDVLIILGSDAETRLPSENPHEPKT